MRNVAFAVLMASPLLFVSTSVCAADPPPTPTRVSGFEIITVDQAKSLLGKAHFFDMRSAVSYGKGHIKGAKAMPYDGKSDNSERFDPAQDRFDLSKLPPAKNTLIVFYSDGPTGWKSFKASVQATRAGYTNVKWLREGTAGWVAKGNTLD